MGGMSGVLVVAPGRGVMWEPPAAADRAGSVAAGGISNPPSLPPSLSPAMVPPLEETGDSDEDFQPPANPADEGDVESCNYGGAPLEETEAGEVGGAAAAKEEEENELGLGDDGSGAAVFPSAASESSDLDEAEKNRRFWESCLQSGYP